jgi:uncharacterized membrane protein (UPF0127 family)
MTPTFRQLVEVKTNRIVVARLEIADTLWKQTAGLLGRDKLQPEEGLWFGHCNAIHTFGMRFPIDVLFLDAEGVALRIVSGLKPWRICGPLWKARVVVELPAGTAEQRNILPGNCYRLDAMQR